MTDITNAPAPTRPTATFTVMLGMVPVPLRLYTPTEDADNVVKANLYHPVTDADGNTTLNPVGMPTTDKVTGEQIDRSQCKKMVAVGDQLVELTDDEIAHVTAGTAVDKGQVNIETFIPLDTIGTRYIVKSWYQARPQDRQIGSGSKKKREANPVADKAYNLLLAALDAEQVAALIRVGLRQKARYAALTPDGHLYFLHFDEEVRAERDKPDVDVSDAELAIARQLINGIGTSVPTLNDERSALLLDYVTAKAAGNVEEFQVAEPESLGTVLDLTAALTASLQAAGIEAKAS